MDVRFCEVQEPPAERHCCVGQILIKSKCAPSGARHQPRVFFLTFDFMEVGYCRPRKWQGENAVKIPLAGKLPAQTSINDQRVVDAPLPADQMSVNRCRHS
jgi:hypothetical protein